MNTRTLTSLSIGAMLVGQALATSPVKEVSFGKTSSGEPVRMYVLTNRNGCVAKVMNYGATLTELTMPDKNGKLGDVILGFDTMKGYQAQTGYLGAIIGRVANRIAKGTFKVDGRTYNVPINNGPNSLHGGLKGYDKRFWKAAPVPGGKGGAALKLSLYDPSGFQGYPGAVEVTVVYTLTANNALRIAYTAKSDKATPINLTNHSYFNLKDAGATVVLGHKVKIYADSYTPSDSTLIPTGVIAPVKGTALDFRKLKTIGLGVKQLHGKANGFDDNFVLRSKGKRFAKAAEIIEPTTGRKMEVWTTQPGLQFYTANFLDGKVVGRHDDAYNFHEAFCMETQDFPDAINHANFPNCILRPGKVYRQVTEYRFSTVKR